jgi:hypothetical protein
VTRSREGLFVGPLEYLLGPQDYLYFCSVVSLRGWAFSKRIVTDRGLQRKKLGTGMLLNDITLIGDSLFVFSGIFFCFCFFAFFLFFVFFFFVLFCFVLFCFVLLKKIYVTSIIYQALCCIRSYMLRYYCHNNFISLPKENKSQDASRVKMLPVIFLKK